MYICMQIGQPAQIVFGDNRADSYLNCNRCPADSRNAIPARSRDKID